MEVSNGDSAGRQKIVPELLPKIETKTASFFRIMNLIYQLRQGVNKPVVMSVLEWLAARNLIRNQSECTACNIAMLLVPDSADTDEYVWCCRICGSTKSVRENSVCAGIELSLEEFVCSWYEWANDPLVYQKPAPEHSCIQTSPLAGVCRDVCEQWLEESPSVIGGIDEGGQSKVVVVGESDYFYRKYSKGLWKEGHWVFGGIEKKAEKCFFIEVPDRTAATLSSLIQKFILPGSTIVSDGWAAYVDIPAIEGGNYVHSIQRGMQQNIWLWAKRFLRQNRRIPAEMLPSYLHALLWREVFKDSDLFLAFVNCMGSISSWN